MKSNKYLLILVLFLGIFQTVDAQQVAEVKFDHLTVEEGLSQSIVTSIAQDEYGFIWIGTEDGLNRYNGLSVDVFYADMQDSSSVANNWITAIYRSRDNKLWICTKKGLSIYHQDTERFSTFYHHKNDSSSIASNSLLSICEYAGDIWIGTSDAGISRYHSKTGMFSHYRHQENEKRSLPGDKVNALLVDHANALWIGTDQGLAKYDAEKDDFVNYREGENYRFRLPSDDIRSLYQSADDILWVGTGDGGMSRFNKTQTRIINYMKRQNIHEMMKKAGIQVIKEDSRGTFWVGTSQGMLKKLQGVSESNFSVIKNSLSEPKSLTNNDISTIFEDNAGLIWIGTKGGGVNIYNSRQKKFGHYAHDYRDPNSISKNVVQAIFETSSTRFWLGVREGGLNKVDQRRGEITRFSNQPNRADSLWAKTVTAIYKDRRGVLWVGSESQGLNKHVRRKKRRRSLRSRKKHPRIWEHIRAEDRNSSPLSSNHVRHIFEDHERKLWVATDEGLNLLVDADSNKFMHYKHEPNNPNSLSDNDIASQAVFSGESGLIWIGTAKGVLNKFDQFTETFTHYRHDPQQVNTSLPNKGILVLYEQDSVIWVGTNGGGLARFNKKTHQVKIYRVQNGLAHNVVYGIESDRAGNLWISTKRGLSNFFPKEEKFQNYYAYQGLQSNVFSKGAVHKGKYSDRLYFGGINGLTLFRPEDIQKNSFLPPVYVTKIRINNGAVPIQKGASTDQVVPLRESILTSNQLYLTHQDKYISFEFVALNYSNPSKNGYKYKLVPFDEDWIETSANDPEASYTNLASGNYTFMVMGANNDGVWNETVREIQITVVPPWWERTATRIAFLVALLALIYLIYRFRVGMLKRQKRHLQQQVDLRTAEVEEQNDQMRIQQQKILKQNKDIQASIQYAQRIQTAILPIAKNIKKLLPQHFILFKPRNVVSGDFYWITEKYGKTIIAVVDCTGHGVPGAFMSVIGAGLLQEMVEVRGITNPATILSKMNIGVQQALQQEEYKTRDGMDMGIACMEKLPNGEIKIDYAGAHNPMWYVQNGEFHQFEGMRQAVGGFGTESVSYRMHTLMVDQPTTIYMASDGFQDQFGGPEGRKVLKKNFKKLLHKIHQKPLDEQQEFLESYFERWKGGLSQTDDVLVFGFRVGE